MLCTDEFILIQRAKMMFSKFVSMGSGLGSGLGSGSGSLRSSITIFLFIILLIYAIKPPFLFDSSGKRRPFGLGYTRDHEKKTLFDLTVIVVVISVILGLLL